MKTADICGIFKGSEPYLMCPVCGSSFCISENKSLVCSSGHCFDFSSRGYINFIPNKKQASEHYTGELFENRAKVFESGAFSRVFDEIYDMILSNFGENRALTLLDAGCGEGYYAKRFGNIPRFDVFAIDIVRDAILAACRKTSGVRWMVADLTEIPVKDGSIDVVLNVLASANYGEFKRVLSKDGLVIKVVPGSGYLKEIREAVKHRLQNKEYSNKEVVEYFERNIEISGRRTLNYKFPAEAALLGHFLQMTPMTTGVDIASINLRGVSGITIDLDILAGKGQGLS